MIRVRAMKDKPMAGIHWVNDATLKDSSKKKDYNKQLFSIIAPKYNFLTRLMSLNNDQHWKAHLISWLPKLTWKAVVLDIASGTGDIPFQIRKTFPLSIIIASDISLEMFKAATNQKKSWFSVCNDMCNLPIPNSSIDIVTGSYALRNAPDLKSLLNEIYRVLKPKGKAFFLDFSQCSNPSTKIVQQIALTLWGCILGLALHHNPAVYGYIAKSLNSFPNRKELRELLTTHGLNVTREKLFFFGFISLLETTRLH